MTKIIQKQIMAKYLEILNRVNHKLTLPTMIHTEIYRRIHKLKTTGYQHGSRKCLIAGMIYFVCTNSSDSENYRTEEEIANACEVSIVSLRKYYQEIWRMKND